jgi:hypothetical protein
MSVSRRRLLLGTAAGAALGPAAAARAAGPSDVDTLSALVGLEQELSLAYGTLDAPGVPARQFRAQSREHARGFSIALRNRGGHPPAPRARAGRATAQQALGLEERALAAYADAAAAFHDGRLLPALGAAMANHGQHVVVLRQALRRTPLPGAFPG